MNQYPKLTFRDIDPLQDYYNDGLGNSWSVARLVDAAKDLEPFDMPIAGIDLDAQIWEGSNMFMLAFHVKKVNEADLSSPIILDWNGSVADGRHRIIKAIIQGKRTIKAVRLQHKLEPDREAS
jgi:hypothetical protein